MKLVLFKCVGVVCLCTLAGCAAMETVGKGIGGLFVPTNGDAPIVAAFDLMNYFIPGTAAIGGIIATVGGLFVRKKVVARKERKMVEAVAKALPMVNTQTP